MASTQNANNESIELWRQEYGRQGIPSSFREDPSGSVVEFVEFLCKNGIQKGRALDLGCGQGRNSLYLAEQGFDVDSMDFVPENIKILAHHSNELHLASNIHVHCQSVTSPWPFEDSGLFDVAIDAFCYKHQILPADKEVYRRELARAMKPGGYYLLTLAGVDDGYYGPLLASSPAPDERVIIDPANGIASVLYRKEDILREFGDAFELVQFQHKQRNGQMHGAMYPRSTLVFYFVRR